MPETTASPPVSPPTKLPVFVASVMLFTTSPKTSSFPPLAIEVRVPKMLPLRFWVMLSICAVEPAETFILSKFATLSAEVPL